MNDAMVEAVSDGEAKLRLTTQIAIWQAMKAGQSSAAGDIATAIRDMKGE